MTIPQASESMRRLQGPVWLREFFSTEAAGGLLLLFATIAALFWANVDGASYEDFWSERLGADFGFLVLDESLRHWVNDGLMTVFFFVVGLEIKRELAIGELATPRRAALPAAAALGGMTGPALIYLAFNAGGDGARGWGIPMATDIAFAVGLISVLGSRVSQSLRVFLLALAIVDDIGAIVVIALFYTAGLSVPWLLGSVGLIVLAGIANRTGVRDLRVYIAIGLAAWLSMHESGVHPTIIGVALALLTPARAIYDRAAVGQVVERLSGRLRGSPAGPLEISDAELQELEELARENQSVLHRLEHGLHPWSSYLVVPVFALANAGVALSADSLRSAADSPVAVGIALGLVLGNPIGITVASYAAVWLGVGILPQGARWRDIIALSFVAGIGFTVSLFITDLAFTDAPTIAAAKIGILAGSLTMALTGLAALYLFGGRGPASITEERQESNHG